MKTRHSVHWILPPLVFAALLLTSCSEDRSALDYQTHPNGWDDPGAAQFHGAAALENSGSGCTACHGEGFTGQGDAVSCYECHGVLHLGVRISQIATHRAFLADVAWNLARCARCHGADYAGGTSHVSCVACHAESGGPSACGTCHALPPVSDETLPYGMPDGAYGAHAAHERFGCDECHPRSVPSASGLAHAGALPAEINFANARVARQHNYSPVFTHLGNANSGNGSCATVYCHSNGRGGSPAVMPQWTAGGIGCTACHHMPPSGHDPSDTRCHECHTNVDPASDYSHYEGIRFLVDSLHVNGAVNF
jgi:predicted CxxxxCH...CXXCH cytochrome family protein